MKRSFYQDRRHGLWLPRDKPKFGSRLINDHPLAQELCVFFLNNKLAGNPIDIVSDWVASTFTGGWLKEGSYFDGVNQYAAFPHQSRQAEPTTEITVFIRWKWNGVSDDWGGLVNKPVLAGAPWHDYGIVQNAAFAGQLSFHVNDGAILQRTNPTPLALPTNRFVNIFGRWKSGEKLYINVYEDGGALYSNAETAGVIAGAIAPHNDPIEVGSKTLGTTNFGGYFDCGGVWSRKIADGEISRICREPYAMFEQLNPVKVRDIFRSVKKFRVLDKTHVAAFKEQIMVVEV